MERTVQRKITLPAFSLTKSELESFISTIQEIFTKETIKASIDVELKNESLKFNNFTDFINFDHQHDKYLKFSIRAYDWDSNESIYISTGTFNHHKSYVRAEANNEAWCAGALETIMCFINRRKKMV